MGKLLKGENMKKLILFSILTLIHTAGFSSVKGFNLTEYEGFEYDANKNATTDEEKTPAQIAVDKIHALGSNHIELNIRARMMGPNSNEIIPVSPANESSTELRKTARLMDYIHSKEMTVGIRPIFFVLGPNGEFPFIEETPEGPKTWWHGNIQPANPDSWFLSFQNYLDRYMLVAKFGKADYFTIGAELYSMTVGLEDQWPEQPFGFPGQWLKLLRYTKAKLSSVGTKIVYDINFTDDSNTGDSGLLKSGGELERWRYRLVDLADPTDPAEFEIWQQLVQFWTELDFIGIDMYRSLAENVDDTPQGFESIVPYLQKKSDAYAAQLDTTLLEIEITLDVQKKAILKEIGYRSVDNSFVDPFSYADGEGVYNEEHQAAAYRAIFESFWAPGFDWFEGIAFWDIPVDPKPQGQGDTSFSPLGKPLTEAQIKLFYQN